MTQPSRYSAVRHFRDLKLGDILYSIHSDGDRRVWAIVEQVVSVWSGPRTPVRGGLFATLSCYSDGTPMLYFRMWYRRSSGIEYGNWEFKPPTDRPRIRLYLELPKGVFAVSRPKAVA